MKYCGWLNINKPEGITSAFLLNRLKRLFPKGIKIGHAGTLDKFACGVLPVAIGPATKTIPFIMDAIKMYTFKVKWGIQTSTDDRDGEVIATQESLMCTENNIRKALKCFLGKICQVPPTYSAVKIEGQRASDRARNKEVFKLEPRQVEIFDLRLIEHEQEESTFQVKCSKGTYVRALTRDIANALGTVGYVTYLRREQVGRFFLRDAILLAKDMGIDDNAKNKITSAIIPIRTVLDDIPAVFCTEVAIARISRGQSISVSVPDYKMAFAVDSVDVIATGFVKDHVFYPKNVFINGE